MGGALTRQLINVSKILVIDFTCHIKKALLLFVLDDKSNAWDRFSFCTRFDMGGVGENERWTFSIITLFLLTYPVI